MNKHTLHLRRLREQALAECAELFEGDIDAAKQWLSQPVRGLGYQTPNDMLCSETGIERLRTLVGRLEHGIFT